MRDARSLAYDAVSRVAFVADHFAVNAVYRVDLAAAPVTTTLLTLTDGDHKRTWRRCLLIPCSFRCMHADVQPNDIHSLTRTNASIQA